tara:strand:- start:4229 stop:4771 length:543 start_codon:yes stop_codon:yes gene_type:complete
MPKIYYFHGFASRFDTSSEKLKTLARLGPVRGHDIDYTQTAEEVIEDSLDKLMQVNPDIIVGTSMGGWLAGILGAETGVPFVAINPVVDPSKLLKARIGKGLDHQGKSYELKPTVVDSYYPFPQYGQGLILLDEGDEVISWQDTVRALDGYFLIHAFAGGSHRFEHMEQSLEILREHAAQ